MTIAACYVSPEGIVLGADSTTTYGDPSGNHYYNHGQKLFEIGDHSNLGMVAWGMGGLPELSYRTLAARLADDLAINPAQNVQEVAQRWADMFWLQYDANPLVVECRGLAARPAFDPNNANPSPDALTEVEDYRLATLAPALEVGFCIAGYMVPDRTPTAYQVSVRPISTAPVLNQVQGWAFWGAPNMIQRLLFGLDPGLRHAVLTSGQWNGTEAEFDALASNHVLAHPLVPLREAIDFVHACISSTIKAMKFSNLSQVCGGPIEIAVITTDRHFRWVRHKPMDTAIREGDAL